MVERQKKRSRKFLGARRWGAGNIKNRRGKGSRGGVGKAGMGIGVGAAKHKWTWTVVYARDRIGKTGFKPWKRKTYEEIDLDRISVMAKEKGEEKPMIELRGYKVLSSGMLSKPAVIKAAAFSKKAEEKIKQSGGEVLKF